MYDNIFTVINKIVENQDRYRALLEKNEAQTRWLLIDDFILSVLGFNRVDVISEYSIDSEERISKYDSLDYCVMKNNKPKLLVESKSLGTDLYEKIGQLKSYFSRVSKCYEYYNEELIGVLTDGDLYLFFKNDMVNSMSDLPFFSIRLSSAEDREIEKLNNFSKKYIDKKVENLFDEEYELNTFYRIDEVNNIINYFNHIGKKVKLDKVSLRGRIKRITNFKVLYRELLNEINIVSPEVLYELCVRENNEFNYSVSKNLKYSWNKKSSSDICIKTKYGNIYFGVDGDENNILYRIIYLLKESHYGLINVSCSFCEVL